MIDDDSDVVACLISVLADHGFEVRSAGDGISGLRLVHAWVPDLICLDIAMPELTGVKVYRKLRGDSLLAAVAVIIVTGVLPQFKEFIHHRKDVPPPDGYIQKPFEAQELLRIVGEVLDTDAFEAFRARGLFDPATAKAFRTHILERGGSEDSMTLYVRFRGHEPEVAPLLARRGLSP